ncbi:MAG: hypothetical protein ACKOKG_13295, partial [Verrucomicrobiota bacterium]
MNRLSLMYSLCVWAIFLCGQVHPLMAQEAVPSKTSRKAALLVENRAGQEFQKLAAQLEDQLSSRAAGQGLVLIGRQLVTDAVAKEGEGARLDALLSERSSALRLAQSLGADLLVHASLTAVTREQRTFDDGALKVTSQNHVLRVAYKIAEAGEGGVLAGDTIRVSRNLRGTQTGGIDSTEIHSQLIDDAIDGILKGFPAKVLQAAKTEVSKAPWIEVSVAAVPVDLTQNPLQLPDLRLGSDGAVSKAGTVPVEVTLGDVS